MLRLRLVLMTALVEILGLLPFLLATGVGSRYYARVGKLVVVGGHFVRLPDALYPAAGL